MDVFSPFTKVINQCWHFCQIALIKGRVEKDLKPKTTGALDIVIADLIKRHLAFKAFAFLCQIHMKRDIFKARIL